MVYKASVRRVGDEVLLAIPAELLESLGLEAGQSVDVRAEGGRLLIAPRQKRRYKLEELLARCEPEAPMSVEDQEWLDAPAVGAEEV